ncbi:MAG: nuclear transport factor 2 family protein [Synechococcales bacterium]|nr:nuclear transport factor 2 family protein [Synechococcales bacterium]
MSRSFERIGLSILAALILVFAVFAVPGRGQAEMVSPPPMTAAPLAQTPDEAQIRQLTAQWFAAWSPGRASIDWDKMGQLFAQVPGELSVFDDAGGSVVVLNSWSEYRATWEPFMEQLSEWQIEPEGEIQVMLDGDLATTTFTLVGGGTNQAGDSISFRQYGTHIWRRMGDRWALVHEHLTTDG